MQSVIVDTYAWMEYFDGNAAYKDLIERSNLKTPSLVLSEISRALSRRKVSASQTRTFIDFVFRRSVILPLEGEQAVTGGALAESERIPLADAIIYSYASEHEPLLTGDEHFRGKKHVLLVG